MTNAGLLNVVLISIAALFYKISLCTTINGIIFFLKQIKSNASSYNPDAYLSLSLIFYSVATWTYVVPILANAVPLKFLLVLSVLFIGLYPVQFLIPTEWALYVISVITGFCVACGILSQGIYISLQNCTESLQSYKKLYGSIVRLSKIIGNGTVVLIYNFVQIGYISFRYVFIYLSICPLISAILMGCLPKPVCKQRKITSAKTTFLSALSLLKTKPMLLLFASFIFAGINFSFISVVYSNCVGNTEDFLLQKGSLVALTGTFIGCGEFVGFTVIAFLLEPAFENKCYLIVLLGYVLLMIAYGTILLNLPNYSVKQQYPKVRYIPYRSLSLTVVDAILLGVGDACYTTQILRIIKKVFENQRSAAFTLFKFVQMVSCGVSLNYSYLGLFYILAPLMIIATLGTITFCVADITGIKDQEK